jgi:hypothetical protein
MPAADNPSCPAKARALVLPRMLLLWFLVPVSASQLSAQAIWTAPPAVRRAVMPLCQQWTRDHLRAPSQAHFATPTVTGVEDDHVLVVGEVEAMNGFGGFNRLAFTCDFELDRHDRTYVLADFRLTSPTDEPVVDANDPLRQTRAAPRTAPLPSRLLPPRAR